jgi:hypothetical protein
VCLKGTCENRNKFGQVGTFPLQLSDLDSLVFPDTTLQKRQQMLEGMSLFTLAHTANAKAPGLANQPFCLAFPARRAPRQPTSNSLRSIRLPAVACRRVKSCRTDIPIPPITQIL